MFEREKVEVMNLMVLLDEIKRELKNEQHYFFQAMIWDEERRMSALHKEWVRLNKKRLSHSVLDRMIRNRILFRESSKMRYALRMGLFVLWYML